MLYATRRLHSGARDLHPPGVQSGCGFCNQEPSSCATDAECKAQGATLICEVRTCACEGEHSCVAGCSSDGVCDEGQRCNLATNRCAQTTCTSDPDCPLDFTCTGALCTRKVCNTSGDCDGFCVENLCYPATGECRAPTA